MSRLQNQLSRALEFLAAQQNADGGWPYLPEKRSFPEPTCYALLALTEAAAKVVREERALAYFTHHSAPTGALALAADASAVDNWGTTLAFFTLRQLKLGEELNQRYLRHLLRERGNLLNPGTSAALKLNGQLRTWGWAMGTASWVEPTAYALIALKSQGMSAHERVKEGEAYLLDRACYGGGWNYGNKEVLGVVLEPMPTTTAFALLALQGLESGQEVIERSLAYLERALAEHSSALSLALGVLCLDAWARSTGKLLDKLLKRQQSDGSWLSNVHLTALAALALQTKVNRKNIFKI